MPRISAATNAAQRENTKRAILNSFGEILYNRGLSGLTMTDVAKNAGIGRTAVYNYFADMGELLVAYALDETERFLNELRVGLEGIENPIEMVLAHILSAAIAENYIPKNDIRELAMLVHGSLSSSAGRAEDAPDEETRERQILNTIRFIQMGLGARFDAEGNPVRLDSEESLPEQSPVQEAGLKVAS